PIAPWNHSGYKELTPGGEAMRLAPAICLVVAGLVPLVAAGGADPDRDITFLHLATHTSSLPAQPAALGLFALTTKDPWNPYAEFDLAHLKKALPAIKLMRPIGSKFQYSNLGAGLLGHALAGAGKADSYESLLSQRTLRPLGLRDTRVRLDAGQARRLVP